MITMGKITTEVEVDLDDWLDDILDYYKIEFTEKYKPNNELQEKLQEYVNELEKDLYVYARPTQRTIESIYEELKGLL